MAAEIRGVRWLLLSLALQNLGRRKARSLLLIAAVAIGSAVVFTGATLMQSIDRSMTVGFTRMGADMMVVPEGALTNITAALLVVEPTDLVLDGDAFAKAGLTSVGRVAAQKIVRVEHSGIGSHHDSVDLIGFDPARDFTIQPWLADKLNRPMQPGDVILGAGRDAPLGSQLLIFGKPHTVYGRLGRTGVGTHERGVFMAFGDARSPGRRDSRRRRSAARRAGARQGERFPGRAGAGCHGAAGAFRHPVVAEGRQGGGRRHDDERHPSGPGRACSTVSSP